MGGGKIGLCLQNTTQINPKPATGHSPVSSMYLTGSQPISLRSFLMLSFPRPFQSSK